MFHPQPPVSVTLRLCMGILRNGVWDTEKQYTAQIRTLGYRRWMDNKGYPLLSGFSRSDVRTTEIHGV